MNCFNLFLILVVSGTYTHLRRAVIKGPNTYVIYDHLELGGQEVGERVKSGMCRGYLGK